MIVQQGKPQGFMANSFNLNPEYRGIQTLNNVTLHPIKWFYSETKTEGLGERDWDVYPVFSRPCFPGQHVLVLQQIHHRQLFSHLNQTTLMFKCLLIFTFSILILNIIFVFKVLWNFVKTAVIEELKICHTKLEADYGVYL